MFVEWLKLKDTHLSSCHSWKIYRGWVFFEVVFDSTLHHEKPTPTAYTCFLFQDRSVVEIGGYVHQFNFVGLSHLGSTPQYLSWVPPIAIASNAQALTEKMRIIHIRCAACHEWVVWRKWHPERCAERRGGGGEIGDALLGLSPSCPRRGSRSRSGARLFTSTQSLETSRALRWKNPLTARPASLWRGKRAALNVMGGENRLLTDQLTSSGYPSRRVWRRVMGFGLQSQMTRAWWLVVTSQHPRSLIPPNPSISCGLWCNTSKRCSNTQHPDDGKTHTLIDLSNEKEGP